ncbi:MAG: DMT family transporter [archaeon]
MIASRKGLVYSLAFSVFWALNIFIDKLAFKVGGVENPLAYSVNVQIVSAVLTTLYALLAMGKIKAPFFSKGNFLPFAFLGGAIAFGNIFSNWGLKVSAAINYGFIIKSTVVFVPVLSFFLLRERISPRTAGLIVAFLSGIYLLSTGGQAFVPAAGDFLILCAAAFYAFSTVYQKKAFWKFGTYVITWGRMLFSAGVLVVLHLFLGGGLLLEAPAFVVLSGCLNVVCVLLITKAIQNIEVTSFSMISMITPVLTALLGHFILAEGFNFVQSVGAAIILGAGTFLVLSRKH